MGAKQDQREKGKRGRPTVLTPELSASIVASMQAGNYLETAAAQVNVAPTTARRWLSQGARRGAESLHREFREAVLEAIAAAEARSLAHVTRAAEPRTVAVTAVTKASRYVKGKRVTETTTTTTTRRDDGDWKAALAFLERKFPDRWAPQVRVRYETEKQLGDIFGRLKGRLDAATYRVVLDALSDSADAEEGGGERASEPSAADAPTDTEH